MTRPFSTDTPSRDLRRRRGTLMARQNKHLYLVHFDTGAEWAYYPGDDLLDIGSKRTAVFDPVADQWWIRPFGGGTFVFSYSNADGTYGQYRVLPVSSSGYGELLDGPPVEQFQGALDVAPNGAFMVAVDSDGLSAGVFLWNGTTFDDTPVDTVTPVGTGIREIAISPDSSTVILGLTHSSLAVAYPVSTAGFGAAYSALSAPVNVAQTRGISWHPSGEAVALAWLMPSAAPAAMTTAVWAWSGGWGSRYADPADAASGTTVGTGIAVLPHFAPDGNTLFFMRTNPGDAANGQFRIYHFTLASGMTTRVPFSASPIAGPISTNQSAFSGRLIAVGSKSTTGLVTYTFDGSTIGPGVAHTEYFDNDPAFPLPEDAFTWLPFYLCFSRDGKFLLGSNNNGAPAGAGIFRLFAVADDGTLTQLGEPFADPFESGWYKIAWRDG